MASSTWQTVLNGPVWLLKVIISLTYSLDLIMVLHFSVTLVALDKVFLKKRSDKLKEWTEDERQVTWTDFAKCTSFPATTQALDPTEGKAPCSTALTSRTKCMVARTFAAHRLPASGTCMVDEREAGSLGEHHRKCRDAMASVGFPLEFDFKHPQNWSDSAIAKAIWAGCSRRGH